MSDDTLPTVTFTITKFRKLTSSHGTCRYTMALAHGGEVVSLDPATNTITVKSRDEVQIQFTATGNYLLTGICFKQTGTGKGDPNGANAFPNVVLSLTKDGSTLTVTDNAGQASSYEFAMLVVGIDEQALGLIDPPIVNRPPA